MHSIKYIIISICVISLTACDKYDFSGFISSPSSNVGIRFDESMAINAENQQDTLLTVAGDNYNIYLGNDIHARNTLRKCARFLDDAFADGEMAFAAILGDITDTPGGIALAHDTISNHATDKSRMKLTTGNHDMYFDQWKEWRDAFGSSTYYFIVKTPTTSDLYIMLDSSNGTLGSKQLDWLDAILKDKRQQHRHCFIMTHTNMWAHNLDQFPTGSFPIEETAAINNILASNNVNYYICGHVHYRYFHQMNGVNYLTLEQLKDEAENSAYVKMSVGKEISYKFIDVE